MALARLKSVAGVTIPDTALCNAAVDLLESSSPGFLCTHCLRTYIFGSLAVRGLGRSVVDEEAAFCDAVLHDLGLVPPYRRDNRFEVDGADAARQFCSKHQVAPERADLVWKAIALHTSPGIATRLADEVALVHLGAGLEFADRVRTGWVNINESSNYWEAHLPFGGRSGSDSGIGRVGGAHVMHSFTELQTVVLTPRTR